jgi:8-oxo-dGTP diphosphatase
MLPPAEYYNSLPKKRLGASVLFVDEGGRWLVLQPTYKKNWVIPGGTVEANESPKSAALREAREETGLAAEDLVLCGVHYGAAEGERTESVRFTFFGGVLDTQKLAAIRLPAEEIAAHRLVSEDEAGQLLGTGFRDTLRQCMSAMHAGGVAYTEF